MSHHDNRLVATQTDDDLWESTCDDAKLQVDFRLGLDMAAAADKKRLRLAPPKEPTRTQLTSLAYHLYGARRDRAKTFGEDLFHEPAWDMLLALYCLPRRGEVLTVSSLSLAANVPLTTGMRWQKTLVELGLVQRGPRILDRRQVLVALTQQGRLLMEEYLTRLFFCHGGVPDTR